MLKIVILSVFVAAVLSQELGRDIPATNRYTPPRAYRRPTAYNPPTRYDDRINYVDEAPKPYAFSYVAPADEGPGSSSRTETGDASGRVQGSYTLTNDEGQTRLVEYIADENGFRATVQTNEFGTANQSPADVHMQSSAPHPYASNTDRGHHYRPSGYRSAVARSPVGTAVEEVEQPIHSEPHVVAQPITAYNRRVLHHGRGYY